MFKKIWEWIKHPHGRVLIPFYLFVVLCIAGTAAFCITGRETDGIASVFYGISAVAVGYAVYTIAIAIPGMKNRIREKLRTNRFMANVLEDYNFKTKVFALLSFGLTVAFATMNLVSAIRYRLIWYGAIAAYYFVLMMFRGGVLLANQRSSKRFAEDPLGCERGRWRMYLASGCFLTVLEIAMIGAITQMMLSERPVQSGEIMAIATAAYTFYKIVAAVYNLVKSRGIGNPVTQSLRNLSFADACMSVVSLTVLMISTFDTGEESQSMQYMKYIVGFAVCAAIIALAAVMIIRADRKLKTLKGGETTDGQ